MTIPNIWRTKGERYQLQGAVCNTCSTPLFPTRHTCPNCSKVAKVAKINKLSTDKFSPGKRHFAMPTAQPDQSLSNVGDD